MAQMIGQHLKKLDLIDKRPISAIKTGSATRKKEGKANNLNRKQRLFNI